VNAVASNIRPAASVLVLRDGPCGVEVLLMRRPERGDNDFRSGACVFPGGVLDAADSAAWRWCLGQDDAQASARLGLREGGLNYFVAALRECFEEVGLLFVCRPDGSPADLAPHAEALRDWRHRLHHGQATMAALCEAFDWRLDLREMAYFSHWLTPVLRPKRFDTRFFVRLAPPAQDAMPDLGEALELMWLTPDEALQPQRALKLLNVTQRTLHDIRGFSSARVAFEHALALRGVALHFPRPALARNGQRFVIESDPAYDEVAHLDPDGRGDLRCELQPGDVQRLSPRLWRVAGASRNAYLVCDPGTGCCVVIDADPGDAVQWQALRSTATGAVRHELSTQADGLEAGVGPACETGARLEIGPDTTLRLLQLAGAPGPCLLLEEERTLIGGAGGLWDQLRNLPHDRIDWLAPTQGFLVNCAAR